MKRERVAITGLASVSTFGPVAGPIAGATPDLRPMTRWPTPGPRRARLVPAFQPGEVVPGLKTRRMDRLSAWALVAANLALKDAGIGPGQLVPERVGVTFGTAFGCVELTEAFMVSIERNGHAKADPILFPETLGNLPASHVARQCGFKGPNVTVSRGLLSGDCALLDAVAQIESGEASVIVVLAGDVVTRGIFDWYEAAGRLAPECMEPLIQGGESRGTFVPGEGVGAVILEDPRHAASRGGAVRASILASSLERQRDTGTAQWEGFAGRLRTSSGSAAPLRCVIAGPGVPVPVVDSTIRVVTHQREVGMFGGGGILGISLGLGCLDPAVDSLAISLGAGAGGQRSGVVLETAGARR